MHEAGVARAIAAELRAQGAGVDRVRILVTGGHDVPAAFDDALRFHLAAELPGLDLGTVEIVHLAEERLCRDCATPFSGTPDTPCPVCGQSGLAMPTPERVELELLRAAPAAGGFEPGSPRRSRPAGDGSPPRS